MDSQLNFIKDKQEWTGTKISFEIVEKDDEITIRFTHHGLVPEIEYFNACSNAWGDYINNSLRNLGKYRQGSAYSKRKMTWFQYNLFKIY